MKFSEHLGKGAWAVASRALPLVYAVALVMVARAIPPAEFGTLGVFQTLFTILFTFSDGFALQAIVKFGVEPGIIMEELVTMTALLFLGFLLIALSIMLLLPNLISSVLNIPQLGRLIPYLALFAVLTMPRVVFGKVLQTRFRMKEIFFVDFANFGVAGIVLIVLLSLGKIHDAESVIRVTMITGLLSSIMATILVRPYLSIRLRYSRPMLSRISHFVRYQAAQGVVSTAQQNFDVLVVSSFTGAAGVGMYNGAKMLFRGFDIIRESMTLFVFPASSKYYSRGDMSTLRTIVEKSVSFLFMIILPAAILLAFGAPLIFHTLYGAKYNGSIPVFRILVLAALFFPIQMVFNVTMTGMGKNKEAFRMFTITLVVNVVLALLLLPLIGLQGAAVAFVAACAVHTFQLYTYLNREIGFSLRQLFVRGFGDAASFLKSFTKAKAKETMP